MYDLKLILSMETALSKKKISSFKGIFSDQFDIAMFVEDQVFGFDVSEDDCTFMEVLECLDDASAVESCSV